MGDWSVCQYVMTGGEGTGPVITVKTPTVCGGGLSQFVVVVDKRVFCQSVESVKGKQVSLWWRAIGAPSVAGGRREGKEGWGRGTHGVGLLGTF